MYNKAIGKSGRPHFDVGSDLYIAWEEDKPEKAADELKAVIRATLFEEAVMEDVSAKANTIGDGWRDSDADRLRSRS
jgi:hypothetical protein